MTGFNQVVIKLQLILTIAICDYDEEYDDDQDTRPNFKRILISAIAFCDYEEEKKTYATRFLPRRCPGHHAEKVTRGPDQGCYEITLARLAPTPGI